MLDVEHTMKRVEVENTEEWYRWVNEIPSINFKEYWDVKIIPPFTGAIVRFQVEHKNNFASIYLDCYDKLGCFGEPYWEVYPYDEDTFRCSMNDTESLLRVITEIMEK